MTLSMSRSPSSSQSLNIYGTCNALVLGRLLPCRGVRLPAGGSGRPQRLDDAVEVPPGGPVRLVGAPAGDRVDDVEVFGQRLAWPAGAKRELELVPDELAVQPLEQADRDGLAGDGADPAVQLPVELGVLQRVAVGDGARELRPELTEADGLVVGDALRRLDRAQRLERHAALGDGHRLVRADHADPGAAVRDALDEALGGEVEQRGPQALPCHPEHRGELFLDQPLTRSEVAAQDRLPKGGKRVRPCRLSGLGTARRRSGHARRLRNPSVHCQQSVAAPLAPVWAAPETARSHLWAHTEATPPVIRDSMTAWGGGQPATWRSSSPRRAISCAASACGTPFSSRWQRPCAPTQASAAPTWTPARPTCRCSAGGAPAKAAAPRPRP